MKQNALENLPELRGSVEKIILFNTVKLTKKFQNWSFSDFVYQKDSWTTTMAEKFLNDCLGRLKNVHDHFDSFFL